MRKTVPLILTLVLLMGICIWAGCSVGGATGAAEGTQQGQGETQGTQAAPAWAQNYPNAPTMEDLGIPEYPASEYDQNESLSFWDDFYEELVYKADQCPVVNVAAFFREALAGMNNMEEIAEINSVSFYFKTADGVPVEIYITPQDPAQPDGPSEIVITVNP